MLSNPILEILLTPLLRRQTWELELYNQSGKCIAKRDKEEVKPECWKGLRIGQRRLLPNGLTIKRIK